MKYLFKKVYKYNILNTLTKLWHKFLKYKIINKNENGFRDTYRRHNMYIEQNI